MRVIFSSENSIHLKRRDVFIFKPFVTSLVNFQICSFIVNNFVKDLKEYGADEDGNNFADDIEIDSDEFTKVLVLSTCVSGQEENRYIVAAVKDREELYEE